MNQQSKNLPFIIKISNESSLDSESDNTSDSNEEISLLKNLTFLQHLYDCDRKYSWNIKECFCCREYEIIHNINIKPIITKYLLDNNKYSKIIIKMLCRLRPDIYKLLHDSDNKQVKSIYPPYFNNNDSFNFRYNMYFRYNNNNLIIENTCDICLKNYCSIHSILNPFFNKKCTYCNYFWNICSWCKYDYLNTFLIDDEIKYESELCNIYHYFK